MLMSTCACGESPIEGDTEDSDFCSRSGCQRALAAEARFFRAGFVSCHPAFCPGRCEAAKAQLVQTEDHLTADDLAELDLALAWMILASIMSAPSALAR